MKSRLIKVWVDAHQYRIFDVEDCATVALLRAALASKLDVDPNSCDLILESGTTEKTTRKLEENESVEKITKRKGLNKIIWSAKGDAGISGPTAVKHEGHISVGAKGIEYRNLPPQWMAIFQALDEKLKTMGEGAMTQLEVQFLIKECASVLLSLPSLSPTPPTSPPLSPTLRQVSSSGSPKRFFARPKSVDLVSHVVAQNDAREAAFKQLELEIVKLKTDKLFLEDEISLLKSQIQTPKKLPRIPSINFSDLTQQISLLQQQLLSEQQTTHALREANTRLQMQVDTLTSSQPTQITPTSKFSSEKLTSLQPTQITTSSKISSEKLMSSNFSSEKLTSLQPTPITNASPSSKTSSEQLTSSQPTQITNSSSATKISSEQLTSQPAQSTNSSSLLKLSPEQLATLQEANAKLQAQVDALTSSNALLQAQVSARTSSQPQLTSSPSPPKAPPPPPAPPPPSEAKSHVPKPTVASRISQEKSDNRDQLMQSIREGKRLRSSTAPPLVAPTKHTIDDSNSVVNILAKVLLDRRKHIQDEKEKEEEDDGDWQ